MQESKNKRLAVLLIVLVGAVITTARLRQSDSRPEIAADLFRQYDLQAVNEFSFESKGKKVRLAYNGSRWRVNEQYAADPALVEVLFATLQQAAPRRPLAVAQQDSVNRTLRDNGVKVTVMTEGQVSQVFYAGGNASKTQAYMTNEGEAVPYLVNIPGYRVYVSGIFELGESGWRDKRVFTLNWRNFERLKATFPGRQGEDYSIELVDQFISIPGMNNVDTTQINQFMDDLLSLAAEEFIDDSSIQDSLSRVGPIMQIEVRDVGKRSYTLALFPPSASSPDMFGLIDDKQWARFSRQRVGPVLRTRKTFVQTGP